MASLDITAGTTSSIRLLAHLRRVVRWLTAPHVVLSLIMAVAFFYARARKMVRQYPWLYEPNGPLGWRARRSSRAG